eukprot:15596619-Heterocapsa_arctica.AAC.1
MDVDAGQSGVSTGVERPVGLGPEGGGVRGFREVAAKLVDLRGVARPPSFSGVESNWPEFRFRLESVAALLDLDVFLERSV